MHTEPQKHWLPHIQELINVWSVYHKAVTASICMYTYICLHFELINCWTFRLTFDLDITVLVPYIHQVRKEHKSFDTCQTWEGLTIEGFMSNWAGLCVLGPDNLQAILCSSSFFSSSLDLGHHGKDLCGNTSSTCSFRNLLSTRLKRPFEQQRLLAAELCACNCISTRLRHNATQATLNARKQSWLLLQPAVQGQLVLKAGLSHNVQNNDERRKDMRTVQQIQALKTETMNSRLSREMVMHVDQDCCMLLLRLPQRICLGSDDCHTWLGVVQNKCSLAQGFGVRATLRCGFLLKSRATKFVNVYSVLGRDKNLFPDKVRCFSSCAVLHTKISSRIELHLITRRNSQLGCEVWN